MSGSRTGIVFIIAGVKGLKISFYPRIEVFYIFDMTFPRPVSAKIERGKKLVGLVASKKDPQSISFASSALFSPLAAL